MLEEAEALKRSVSCKDLYISIGELLVKRKMMKFN